ncbi:MAG: hypothetical protein GVY23_07660 [Spirochaetes bacterium]|jgi:hypothetical protein|nr:hypothetical protein [Spirochaetota bacterium]
MSDYHRMNPAGGEVGGFDSTFESKDNETLAYERFYYCKRYVAGLSLRFQTNNELRNLGARLGYNPEKGSFIDKFTRRRAEWDSFERDIPCAYLEAIGVLWAELDVCAEADYELFRQEIAKARYPRKAVVRYIPAVYGTYRFPEGTSEREAIEMLERSNYARFHRAIVYPELLVIWLGAHRDGGGGTDVVYDYYEPVFEKKKDRLQVRPPARGIGQTRIG